MKKINLLLLITSIVISCTTKTTSLTIDSKLDIETNETIEVKITRNQEGNIQTNDSNDEYLNYYFYYIKDNKEIELTLSENNTNTNCNNEAINIQNGNKLSNIFYRNIEFKKKGDFILVYINCISEVYEIDLKNNESIKIKFKIEDKVNTKIKDSIVFNLKTS